jgi:hypothetical protein
MSKRISALLGTPSGSQLLLAWLLLKNSRIELEQFGLDYSLKQAGEYGTSGDGRRSVQLLQALLSLQPGGTTESVTQLEGAFGTAAGRNFMLVHESSGTEWFNKERYEELQTWIAALSLLELAGNNATPRATTIRLGLVAAETARLTELALHAGYRTALLLHSLKPVTTTIVAQKSLPPAKTKQPARKKTDVQGTARTKTAKTPDNKLPR